MKVIKQNILFPIEIKYNDEHGYYSINQERLVRHDPDDCVDRILVEREKLQDLINYLKKELEKNSINTTVKKAGG